MAGKRNPKAGKKSKPVQGQKKAGLHWGTGRTQAAFRNGRFADRYSKSAGVFMAGVLQYLTQEIFDLAVDVRDSMPKTKRSHRLTPRMLTLAIRRDDELNKMFAATQISQGGILPNINEGLWARGKKGAAGATQEM